jgi:hypothetical protein
VPIYANIIIEGRLSLIDPLTDQYDLARLKTLSIVQNAHPNGNCMIFYYQAIPSILPLK